MILSYSRVSSFVNCPFKYKLTYLDGLKTKFNLDPTNALVLGTAMHIGIQQGSADAVESYYSNYPTVTDGMLPEAQKLICMSAIAREALADKLINAEFEYKILTDDFVGFIDMMVPVEGEENVYDLYDFKYSNAVDSYKESQQLHLYKYFLERAEPGTIVRNLGYVMIPKVKVVREENEDELVYLKRIVKECHEHEVKIVEVEYNPSKVIEFLLDAKKCIESTEFPKNKGRFCYWCDFKAYCESNGKLDGKIIYPTEE